MANSNERRSFPNGLKWFRPAFLLLMLALMAFATVRWGPELTIDRLAQRQNELRAALSARPVVVLASAYAIYVAVTSTLIGSATAISLLYGWLFGWILGTVIVSFASTTGATLTFLASRYLFRAAIEKKFAASIQRIDEAFRREESLYLLSLRLIPGIPFFLLNAFMGLTPIRLWTYWWVSQLGMLPATLIIVYAGSTVPDLATLQQRGILSILSFRFILGLAFLGLFPLFVSWLRRRWLRRAADVG